MILRYKVNKKIRTLATWMTGLITSRSNEERVDFQREPIRKILLVRATFRMGHSVLATPAVFLFRKNFPHARIDFAGPAISKPLFQNLPITNHYQIHQRFPKSCWAYVPFMKQIRSTKYDLAIDVSCSKSALGAFIVGFSGARFRVGLRGRWDHWFNVRVERPAQNSKYRNLPDFVRSMGLQSEELLPSLILSADEKENGRRQLEMLLADRDPTGPIVGVFVGGRKSWRKRWPKEHFKELISDLHAQGVKVIVFRGPEEKDVVRYFERALPWGVPFVFESSPRKFAALVSNCDLFVSCDSGPMHMACAMGVRTIAIFLLQHNRERWAPPSSIARLVDQSAPRTVKELVKVCRMELDQWFGTLGGKLLVGLIGMSGFDIGL